MKLSKTSFSVLAIAFALGSFAFAGTASAAQTVEASSATAKATATSMAVAKDDCPVYFMVKNTDGSTLIVRENELDRPALTNISGGAKSVSVAGKAYEVDSTIVSRYGKTRIIDRSMVMMADDER